MFAAPAPPPQLCWISSKAPTKPAQIPANGIARPWSARPSPRLAPLDPIPGNLTRFPLRSFLRCQHRIAVDGYGVFDVARVAAGESDHHRNLPRAAHAKNQFITLLQALNGQRQPAKLVFAIRVGAGDVAQQVWLKLAESRAEGVIQPAEIIGVADAIRQIHING